MVRVRADRCLRGAGVEPVPYVVRMPYRSGDCVAWLRMSVCVGTRMYVQIHVHMREPSFDVSMHLAEMS